MENKVSASDGLFYFFTLCKKICLDQKSYKYYLQVQEDSTTSPTHFMLHFAAELRYSLFMEADLV